MTLYPPYNQGDFVAWGPQVYSGGTAFENCCICVDYATPECQSACTPGCRISTATNYSNNDYCDCSGVWMGTDMSCCTFTPPCSAGCTDILASNYNGNATCDCGGVPGGTDYSCCIYDGPCISGCTDITAGDYNPLATCDCSSVIGGTDYSCCKYTPTCTSGCTDPTALNYNSLATCDCLNVSGGTNYSCCEYCPCVVTPISSTPEAGNSAAGTPYNSFNLTASWSCSTTVSTSSHWTYPSGGISSLTLGAGSAGSSTLAAPIVDIQGDGIYTLTVTQIWTVLTQTYSCTTNVTINVTNPPTVISGCTDPLATNYNPSASVNDGSCTYSTEISGCTDLGSFGYNPIATADCAGVPGGTDYSCCLSSCDICATNNINGAWNVGLLNAAPFGWAGGYFDNTFQFYYENDTTTYNGCCYLCHKSNVGPYFECSDFATYGAPDTNPAWLSCCPNACDVECFSGCTQTIPSPSLTGNCAGTTFGTSVTGPWDTAGGPIGNPTDSSVMDYFINPGNGNQNTIIPGITFELPRTLLANNFNLDCNGCNGPSTSDGSTVLWQVIGIAVQGQTGNINAWTSWNDLTSSPENTWDLITYLYKRIIIQGLT